MDIIAINIISAKDPGEDSSFSVATIMLLDDESSADGEAAVLVQAYSLDEVKLAAIGVIVRGE